MRVSPSPRQGIVRGHSIPLQALAGWVGRMTFHQGRWESNHVRGSDEGWHMESVEPNPPSFE